MLGAHAVVLVLFAAGIPRLAIDNSPQGFLVEDAEELGAYRDFQHLFGRDHMLRVALRGAGVWTPTGLAWLARLEPELAAIPGVLGAAGPWTHHRTLPGGASPAAALGEEAPAWPPVPAPELRRRLTADPLDRAAGWVSDDGELVTVMVVLFELPPGRQRAALASVRVALAGAPAGVETDLLGLPVLAEALDAAVRDVAEVSFPLLVALATALLLIALRSGWAAAAPLTFVGFVMAVVLGAMGWAGARLDAVVCVLFPLLYVIALATALYLLVEYRHQRRSREPGADRDRAALRECYRERAWPVVWTGVTTAAGFGSLALGALPPVRSLGLWTAAGITLTTLEAFFLYPALLEALAGRASSRGRTARLEVAAHRLGRRVGELALARRRAIGLACGLVAVAAALALARLDTGPGLLEYFRPSHPVRTELERVEAQGIGVVAGEIVVRVADAAASRNEVAEFEAPAADATASRSGVAGFEAPARLRALDELAQRLRSLPGVLSVLSPYDLLAAAVRSERAAGGGSGSTDPDTANTGAIDTRTMNTRRSGTGAALGDPTDAELVAALRAFRAQPDLEVLLASALTRDGTAARVSLIVPMAALGALDPVFDQALEQTRARFSADRVWLTGVYPLVLGGQRAVLQTMAKSLLLTLAVVAALFALVTRSARGLLACLAPNLLAVLFVLGLMAALGVPVDGTTLMITAVVLGLAVDDTFHTLGAFRRRALRHGAREGAVRAIEHTAPGHLLTSATLIAGFLACGVSSFVPVSRFGLLGAVALLFALAADLLLTPVLLAGLGEREVRALVGARAGDKSGDAPG